MIEFSHPKSKDVLYKKTYKLWHNMMSRCYNKKHFAYKNYGAKGVKVCDNWLTYSGFINDIDLIEGWSEELFINGALSLDKDKNGNSKIYSLRNCSFISKEENNKYKPNQQRTMIAISPLGEIYEFTNQSEFARNHGLTQTSIADCLRGKCKTHKKWKFKYK